MKIFVKRWINESELHNSYPKYRHVDHFDDFHEDALIKELVEHKYIIYGDTHQVSAIPVFSDGVAILPMRRWGKIMQTAYRYITKDTEPKDFFLSSVGEVEEVLPPCSTSL